MSVLINSKHFWRTISQVDEIPLCGDDFLSKLSRLKTIGSGSYGTVSLWQHKETHETYVQKKLMYDQIFASNFLSQLLRDEIVNHYTLSKSNCPHICKIICITQDQQHNPLIIQDYCGDSLRKEFDAPVKEKVNWVYQLIEAFNCIHSQGIVHLDIKPDNLLIDNKRNLKVIDFGLSTHVNLLSYVTSRGTLNYLAPESYQRNRYSTKTDSWAIGCVIRELFEDEKVKPIFIDNLITQLLQGNPDDRWDMGQAEKYLKPFWKKINSWHFF